MVQNGKTLSMHNGAIWKGTYDDNGMLLKLHENCFTIGYSALLSPDGTSASKVGFGDGVFYDATQKNNRVFAGAPTVPGAAPKFAGIVVREPAIASGYPAINNEVAPFQKGLLCKEGFIEYKKAFVAAEADKEILFDNANVVVGTNMYVKASDGAVYFGTAKNTSADVLAGRIVALNPDDKTVTVYVSPVFEA